MKSVKGLIKKYYQEKFNHNDNIEILKEKANIEKKKTGGLLIFMKTKKLAIVSTAIFIVTVAAIVIGCSLTPNQQNKPTVKDTVITLDLNPSIQLTVDDQGLVASVYGANDEGKMIIVDVEEQIIGKEYDKAIDLIIEIETECGFFVKASTSEEYNNLTITIDADATTNELAAMEAEIKQNIEEKLTSLNIEIGNKITTIKNNTKDALIEKLLTLDENLTTEELNELSHEELINLIAAYHIERINLPTQTVEQMYNEFKEYEINIAESQIFQNFVTTSSKLNDIVIANYNNLYEAAQNALVSLKATYEEFFISENSIYNEALKTLVEIKAEVLELRTEIEQLEDGIEKSIKLALLTTKETALEAAETALELAKETVNTTLEHVTASINQTLTALKEYIMETDDLTNLMNEKANEISQELNTKKVEFINNFEAEYKDYITEQYNKLVEHKANLIAQLKDQD